MASPYISRILNLSSGQIHFADPTKYWDPSDLPNLPSSLLSLGAQGIIEDQNVSTLTFTNKLLYQPYEPSTIYGQLQKPFQLNQSGLVTYEESRVGVVSTLSDSFTKTVQTLYGSNVGGAGIRDVFTNNPDTLTNAIGKLDTWIANAFLLQPPSVSSVAYETNSLFGSMQWENFKSYNILDKAVPYVANILIIIGDPSTSDYVSLLFQDSDLFPYRQYTNGISPVNHPLVKVQLFTDFFVNSGDIFVSKAALPNACIQLLDESGACALPGSGKVCAIDYTDRVSTYTTVSLYLPNITNAYPKNTNIPISIAYLNKTQDAANIENTYAIISNVGPPSAPSSFTATTSNVTLVRPTFSDSIAGVTLPYFSSYIIKNNVQTANTAHESNIGFKYGLTSPSNVSPTVYTIGRPYLSSVQTYESNGLPYATRFSTSAYAINSAYHIGPEAPGIYYSTLFPVPTTSSISSAILQTSSLVFIHNPSITSLRYAQYSYGWDLTSNVVEPVAFVENGSSITLRLNAPVKWNDVSYPGDRSTIILECKYTNDSNPVQTVLTAVMSTASENYTLNTPYVFADSNSELEIVLSDSFSNASEQGYFYTAEVRWSQTVSSFSTFNKQFQMALTNSIITGYTGSIEQQIVSTSIYSLKTETPLLVSTTNAVLTSVTSTTLIAGILAPEKTADFLFDIEGKNFANFFGGSNFATARILCNSLPMSPLNVYESNVFIYSNGTEVITSPIPTDTILRLSSLGSYLNSNAYHDPFTPGLYAIQANLTSKMPNAPQSTKVIPFYSTFIDHNSQNYINNFSNSYGSNGMRVLSLLPRLESPGTQYNMNDGYDSNGHLSNGADVAISSFLAIDSNNVLQISSFLYYNHFSTLNVNYTNPYSRELLFTNATYTHPGGYDFTGFGAPGYTYPDFTYDLVYDTNYGNRYASFLFETPEYTTPSTFQYARIKITDPSFVSTIAMHRSENCCFPRDPVDPTYMDVMKVRMHMKILANYDVGTRDYIESSWINCFKQSYSFTFDDSVYDVGGCISTLYSTNSIIYTVQMNRRDYNKLACVVRLGISQDGSIYNGDPISFKDVSVTFSDFII
jgi:hypothetical protein